jgi:hypothetical protein
MPGSAAPNYDHMTPFKLQRIADLNKPPLITGGNETYGEVEEVIQLSNSKSAYKQNSIALYFRQTDGQAVTFDVTLYGVDTSAGSDLLQDPPLTAPAPIILVAHEPNISGNKLVIFDTNIYALDYKVVITGAEVNDGETYPILEVYESHSAATVTGTKTTSLNPVSRNVMNTLTGGYPGSSS